MLFSPLMNGTRIWMHRGERKRIGETCWCDMVSNAFLARRDTIARVRWDDEIKTYEHWEFFYRASQIEHLQIAVALDCSVVHDHVAAKPYGALRARPSSADWGFVNTALIHCVIQEEASSMRDRVHSASRQSIALIVRTLVVAFTNTVAMIVR